ncbi:MAG: TOBE domain-containing protein [Propionibacteriales bacterium]|nr:TOBE domain-containing protein [Propionibacteriales bacterium]
MLAFGTRLRLGLTDGTTVFVGDQVTVAIRPENVTVRRSADAAEALVADVTHTTMLGHLCYYVLDLAGTTLRVQTASDVELDRGDRVSVDIDDRHASVFPAEVDAESPIEEERV